METNGNSKSKLAQVLPGAVALDTDEEYIPILTPDGEDIGMGVVYGFVDGQAKAGWDRTAKRLGKRGQLNYDEANFWLYDQKIKRVVGLTEEDCGGVDPKVYLRTNKNGHILLHATVNELLTRQLPSASESRKSSTGS